MFYSTCPWGLYRRTYYGRNLRISVIILSVCLWQSFSAQTSVYGQAPALPVKHQTRRERLARDTHSNLLRKSVNYRCNNDTGPWCRRYETCPFHQRCSNEISQSVSLRIFLRQSNICKGGQEPILVMGYLKELWQDMSIDIYGWRTTGIQGNKNCNIWTLTIFFK